MKLIFVCFIFAISFFAMNEEFKTKKAPSEKCLKPLFTFGVIADVQYSDQDPLGTRYYRESLPKLREAISLLKRDSVQFIIDLGDLIDKDYDSFKPVLSIFDSSGLQTYHITGNHDYSVEPHLKSHLPVIRPTDKGYFTYKCEKFRFLFLNGNEISTYASNNEDSIKKAARYIQALKNKKSINAIEWNGGISKKQLEWIESEINNSEDAGEMVILFCHFPVWPENNHNLLNYKEVLSVLEKHHNIVAWFNGHNHSGNYGWYSKIHFITLKGMVETKTGNSFCRVEVYQNRLLIKGYGREESRNLAF